MQRETGPGVARLAAVVPRSMDRFAARLGAPPELQPTPPVAAGGDAAHARHDTSLCIDPLATAKPSKVAVDPPPSLENDLAGTGVASGLSRRRQILFVLWILVSVTLHGLPVAAFVLWPSRAADFGALDTETEAVSVELVSSNVLEALEAQPTVDSAAQQAVVMLDGNAQEDNTQATPEDTAKREEVVETTEEMKPAPKKEEAAPDEPAPIKVERADAAAEQSNGEREDALAEPKLQETKEKQQEEKKEEKREAAQATQKGGVTVSATEGSKASSPKVSASTGEMRTYAAAVRAHVAAHKPAGGSRLGTVVISFGITHDGRLSFAKVNSSSGIQSLDERALAAIRRSEPFPMPPAGATERQLTYSIPIYFK